MRGEYTAAIFIILRKAKIYWNIHSDTICGHVSQRIRGILRLPKESKIQADSLYLVVKV